MAVFSGHDHGNTWCRRWRETVPGTYIRGNGINLCFGQHTGYGGYGTWVRGGRQIILTEEKLQDRALDTYIRLETKFKVGAVSLNSTYNQDTYPVTSNDKTS
ncbi:metallophosphoesterase [Purpureocillium lavendulum]|uniref:Metallophosphoesterase n=1 Tax=Purpureocillium lavendulum TaxID=1247861 RepID=A0AB34G6M3_9HYPO|nr:metallophosphoesterase [Purpureocillium lavendulum]